MARSLVNLIEAFVKNKKIKLSTTAWARVKLIEREAKGRKIKPDGAIVKLKEEKELKGSLSEVEWKNIKEQIEDIVD